ncbi:hypothetical protein ES702_06953 [subsurface metagenome]
MNYILNRWEKKLLLVNCEISLHSSICSNGKTNPNREIIYDTIDFLLDSLGMSIYEAAVLDDHIHFLKAMLGLNNPSEISESAYQQYHLYMRWG